MKLRFLNNDYILSMINKGVLVITGFLITALLNRYLGPELKGEYAYFMNVVNFIATVGNLGVYQSYPKSYKDKMPDVKNKYVSLICAQLLVYSNIAVILGVLDGRFDFLILFLLVPSQIAANQLSMVVMVEDIRYRQYVQMGTLILKTGIMYIVAICMPALLLYVFGALLVINILQCILYINRLRAHLSFGFLSKEFVSVVMKFGFFASASEILLILNYKADIFILKYFVDYHQIGLYSVGAGIAEFVWFIPDAFKEVLFSRSSRGNPIKELNLTIKTNMLVSVLIILVMLVFGKEIIMIYSGPEYLDTLSVTRILLLGVPAMALFKVTNPLYFANGKQKLYCYILLKSDLVCIVLNVILIPIFGINGAAVGTVTSFTVCGLSFYIKYIREYKIAWYEPLLFTRKDLAELKKFFIR